MAKICKIKEISHMNYEIATDRFKVVFEDKKGNLIERIFEYRSKITKSKKPTLFMQMCLACGYSKVPKNMQNLIGHQVKISVKGTRLSCYSVNQTNTQIKKNKSQRASVYYNMSQYDRYIQSSKWFHLKTQKLNQVNHACENCHIKHDELDCHHRHYQTVYNESLEDLQILCPICHYAVHSNGMLLTKPESLIKLKNRAEKQLSKLKEKGLARQDGNEIFLLHTLNKEYNNSNDDSEEDEYITFYDLQWLYNGTMRR